MPLTNDIKSDIKAAKKLRLPWWGVLCLIFGSLLLYWLFDHFGRFDIALPTLVSIGMLGFVIAVKRKLGEACVVLGYHGHPRGSSCPLGSVRSLDHEVGSGNCHCSHWLGRYLRDARDSRGCREIYGRPKNH